MSVRVARSRVLVAEGHALAAVARVMQITRQALYRVPKPRTAPQRRPPANGSVDGGEGLRADLEIPHNVLDSLPALPDLLSPEQAERHFLAAHRRLGGESGRRELSA